MGGARFFYSSSRQVYVLWMLDEKIPHTCPVPGKSCLRAQNMPYMCPVSLLRAHIHGGTCPTVDNSCLWAQNTPYMCPPVLLLAQMCGEMCPVDGNSCLWAQIHGEMCPGAGNDSCNSPWAETLSGVLSERG